MGGGFCCSAAEEEAFAAADFDFQRRSAGEEGGCVEGGGQGFEFDEVMGEV